MNTSIRAYQRNTHQRRILQCASVFAAITVFAVLVAFATSITATAQPATKLLGSTTSNTLDSLERLLPSYENRQDSSAIRLYNEIAREYFTRDAAKSVIYAQRATDNARKLGNQAPKQEAQQWLAQSLSNLGAAYFYLGKYDFALENHLQALKLRETLGDQRGQAISLNNIGLVYYDQNKYDLALAHHTKALKLREEIGDQQGLSSSLINIGLVYSEQAQFDSAQAYFSQALSVFRKMGDRKGEASALNNLGRIYTTLGYFDEALLCYRESLALKRQMGNKEGECASLNNIGNMLSLQGKYREALEYSQQALALADNIGSLPRKQEALETVSDIYTQLGDNKKALEAFRKYVEVRDEIMNRETQNKTLQLQAQYESDKKDQEIKHLNSERELQTTVRNVLVGGAVLLAGLLVLAFNRYRAANLANAELTRQKKLVEEQSRSIRAANDALNERNFELDQKNHEIMDSIFYAERIQRAVLPSEIPLIAPVVEQFIVYKPRDVVSGDFYWAHTAETPEHSLISLVAAIDCTGHGVPGAFMSMIGNTLLNQIVLERRIYDPAKILEELNIAVRTALKQDAEEEEGERNSRDGMDICLCRIERNRVVFAGAKRPLYVVRPSTGGAECEEIKGDKHSIGGKQRTEHPTFTNHDIAITQPMTLYLTTDGFADQPNPEMLKYGTRRLKQTLVDMAIFPTKRQRQSLLSELKQFQGNTDQRDDITMIGVKVKPAKQETTGGPAATESDSSSSSSAAPSSLAAMGELAALFKR